MNIGEREGTIVVEPLEEPDTYIPEIVPEKQPVREPEPVG